jgi:nitric oxide reductase NorQ protein
MMPEIEDTAVTQLAAVGPALRVQPENDNVVPEPGEGFVITPRIQDLTERALAYLEVGYPLHFAGPAGTGKTTLAFHAAASLGRPVILIHGDDEFGSSDLVGKDTGYRKSKVIDNYIHSVLKTEENVNTVWMDNRLTTACQKGYTLIYDEFNRSRPEANNALLSVLEEKILNLPSLRQSGEGYVAVHPDFRAIFTSNPEEYAGVHKTQDALMDRLITIHLANFDRETEIQVTMAKSESTRADAETIVDIVRELRGVGVNNHRPTIRASIAIARILVHRQARAHPVDPVFQQLCRDILYTDTAKVTREGESLMPQKIDEAIAKVCGRGGKGSKNHNGPRQVSPGRSPHHGHTV